MENKEMRFATQIIHAKKFRDPVAGAHISPIYQTSTFTFDSIDEAIERNQDYNQDKGFTYARFGTPTTHELEQKLADIEGGEACLALSSGMAAISTALLSALETGDHLIAGKVIYGCTFTLLIDVFKKYGIEVTLVDTTNLEEIEKAIRPNTKVIYIETPANPTLTITDIEEVSKIAKANDALLMVDSTFASPALQNPLKLGADVVVHSATKYISGHGAVVAGVIIGSEEFIYNARFPNLQVFGGCLSSFDAWLLMLGMKTLSVRMEKHCENAMTIAKWLETHPQVERVYYPGLESHPTHEIAKKQMRGYGGMMSFDIKGGLEAAKAFLNSVKLFGLGTSLGNVDSLIQHSPTMSHFGMTAEERAEVSIIDGQVRVSIGLEAVEDLIEDINQALEKAKEVKK